MTKISRLQKFIGTLALVTAAAGGQQAYQRLYLSKQTANQIVVPPQTGMYHGVMANLAADKEHLYCFAQMSGQHIDLAQRFVKLREMMSATPFPHKEAVEMKKTGGALNIIIEPGSGSQSRSQFLGIKGIIDGTYNEGITNFATGAKDFGGPVLVSFRADPSHQISTDQAKAAFQKIRALSLTAGATNITWVWQVNPNDPSSWQTPPPADEFQWVQVSAYNEGGLELLKQTLPGIKALGKPIIVEFGSSGSPAEQATYINQAVAFFSREKIGATIFMNISQLEGRTFRPWGLTDPAAKTAYQAALRPLDLTANITTGNGISPDRADPLSPLPHCPAIESRYSNHEELERINDLIEHLENLDLISPTLGPINAKDANLRRIDRAKTLAELAELLKDPGYLQQAEEALKDADKKPDEGINYHPRVQYVREYFEVILQMAKIQLLLGNLPKAIQTYERLIQEFSPEGKEIMVAQQIHQHSVPGYLARTRLELADLYFSQGMFEKAEPYYQEVSAWGKAEAEKSAFRHYREAADSDQIKYLEAKAQLGLAFINLHKAKGDYSAAKSLFQSVLAWEKTGQLSSSDRSFNWAFGQVTNERRPFLDLAFASLIGILRVSAATATNLEEAKANFDKAIDWPKLNRYDYLKKILLMPEVDLTTAPNRWQLMIDALSSINLPEPMKKELETVRLIDDGQH
ncbi:MAG: tetratricopeptide repeat protein [Candidatus Margulisiibacteriota bacterium]|jgi:tetratricopeptide (TPR) repeat protein